MTNGNYFEYILCMRSHIINELQICLHATTQCFFASNDYAAVSIRSVVRESSVHVTDVHYPFRSNGGETESVLFIDSTVSSITLTLLRFLVALRSIVRSVYDGSCMVGKRCIAYGQG